MENEQINRDRQTELEKMEVLDIGDEQEKTSYLNYLCWKVLRDLYEVMKEDPPEEFSWDDCVAMMESMEKLRKAAAKVMTVTMKKAIEQGEMFFNFNNPTIKFFEDENNILGMTDDDLIQAVNVFPHEKGMWIISAFLFSCRASIFYEAVRRGNIARLGTLYPLA